MANSLHLAFQKSSLFRGLTFKQIERFIAVGELLVFPPNGIIIQEGEVGHDFFLIISGSVEILKHEISGHTHRVATLSAGDTIGELGLIEHVERIATIRVLEEATVLRIETKAFEEIAKDPNIALLTSHNLAVVLGHRLKDTNEITVRALETSLQQATDKIFMGNAMVSFFILSGLYTMFVEFFSRSTTQYFLYVFLASTCVFLITLIFKSGYSLEFYGITTRHWRKAIIESIIWSLIIIFFITVLKYLAIHLLPSFSDEPLINYEKEISRLENPLKMMWIFLYIIISSPIQELIFRGCLQGTLQHFVMSPYKGWIANFTASLIFCMAHFFISPTLAFLTMLVSLVWGAMYIYQKTLIGVTLSHILVGIWAFQILGVERLLMR